MEQLRSAWRSILKNRTFSLINVTGLALGTGIALTVFWIVRFETGFDTFRPHAERFYRLRSHQKTGEYNSHIPQGVILALNTRIAGVEKAANAYKRGNATVRVGQQVFLEKRCYFADPVFAGLIGMTWVSGSPQTSLSRPDQVVLDEPTAHRLFRGNALGKTLRFNNERDLTVSGIVRAAPANSEFQMGIVISRETLKRMDAGYQHEGYWDGGDSGHQGFVLLKEGASPKTVETLLNRFTRQRTDTQYDSFELIPIADSHFDSQADTFSYYLPKWMIYALISTGIFLILIACINFINLATVQALQKSREMAIRKLLGSSRSRLMARQLVETGLLTAVSILLGCLLAEWLLSWSDQLLNTEVRLSPVWNSGTLLFLLCLGVGVTLLAGLYPALLASGTAPVAVLRSSFQRLSVGGISLRKTLIVGQFAVAQILVVCTLAGLQQLNYIRKKDLGFFREGILTVEIPDRKPGLRAGLREELLANPHIQEVTYGLSTPSSPTNNWWTNVESPLLQGGKELFQVQHTDTNYLSFFHIPLLAGRGLTTADSNQVVLVNEKTVRQLGLKQPEQALGRSLTFWNKTWTIVGVVKDYHSQDLKQGIQPHVIWYAPWNFQQASLRVDGRDLSGTLATVEKAWKRRFPDYAFRYSFLDQSLGEFYANDEKMTRFLTLFACVGILIGCLGLYGLVSFVCVQRTKEIGIRKVLGASVPGILLLLSKDFVKLVLVAAVIATPAAWYILDRWLSEFVYHVPVEAWVFAATGLLSVVVALGAVSFQSVRVALLNPVRSLKSE
jgi:putative ABC transport system permease protein